MKSVYFSSALIAALGVATLTGLTFGPTQGTQRVALVVPPWATDGIDRAAATGLAIVDMHWNRHIIILDTGGDPTVLARLQDQGFWLVDATGAGICGAAFEGT